MKKYLNKILIKNLVKHKRIVSITQRLKHIKPKLEKLITTTIKSKTKLVALKTITKNLNLNIEEAKRTLWYFSKYINTPGGYLCLKHLGRRNGDNARMSCLSFKETN